MGTSNHKKLNVSFNRVEDKSTKNSDSLTEFYLDSRLNNRYYSISSAINQHRQAYYMHLEKTQQLVHNPNLELNSWIKWHTQSIEKSIETSIVNIDQVLEKTK